MLYITSLFSTALLLVWLLLTPAAIAAPCRTGGDGSAGVQSSPLKGKQTVCIVEIRRSAKNPWEYRVTLSQDGVKQPQEIYNCRDRVRVGADGFAVPFEAESHLQTRGNGEWICRLVRRS